METPPAPSNKDALIAALLERIETLMAENARLAARVAELEASLDLPPKTPDNSSLPPSKGQKPSLPAVPKRRAKPHPGANRLLHPEPTRHRDVRAFSCQACGADVSGAEQSPCEVYDRLEIPAIVPDVTRVSLHGGICPCCTRRFKAEPPAGLEPGSPPLASRGREGLSPSPPSEPRGRFSRTRLSSRWLGLTRFRGRSVDLFG